MSSYKAKLVLGGKKVSLVSVTVISVKVKVLICVESGGPGVSRDLAWLISSDRAGILGGSCSAWARILVVVYQYIGA